MEIDVEMSSTCIQQQKKLRAEVRCWSQCFLPFLLSPALMWCVYAANQTLAASLHEMLALSTLPHTRLPDRILHDKTEYKIKRFPAVHAWENSELGK